MEIDEEQITPASWRVWIYQFLNRINYEHEIKSVTVDDVTVEITDSEGVYNLSLGENEDLESQE